AHVPSKDCIGWPHRCVCRPSHGESVDVSQKLERPLPSCSQAGWGARWEVPQIPEIVASSGGISVQSSDISEIAQCVSRNSFPAPNITWHKNGEQLQAEEKTVKITATRTRESSGLYTVSSTLFAHVTREDRHSLYHCTVHYHLQGQQRALESPRVNITVFYPAEHVKLQVVSSSNPVKEGDDVQLVCEADGNPAPVFSFYKRELEGNWQDLSSLADTNSGVLDLHDVNKNSSGFYRCRTLDLDDLRELEEDVELFVNWKPRIVAVSSPLFVRQDEMVTLTCKAIAYPPPSVHWSINGTTHEYVENRRVASNLTVRVSHELLRAGAMCRVSNELGVIEEHIQLLDQKTPESKGVIIVAIIVCILVVAVLGSVIYFLHKKGKIPCGRAGKQDM
ncbi:Cell surface glycoprotein MUC18, partial [Calypte anna]